MKCVQQLLERTLQFQVKFRFAMNTGLQNGTRKHKETPFPVFSKFEHVVKIDYKTRVVQLLRVPFLPIYETFTYTSAFCGGISPDSHQM